MAVKDDIVALEKKFWESAGNQPFYEKHFARDGVMAFPIGLLTKGEVVQAMKGADEWESYTIDDPHFVQISSDTAALAYTTIAVSTGEPDPYAAAVISVYVKREGDWRLILHQQTPMDVQP